MEPGQDLAPVAETGGRMQQDGRRGPAGPTPAGGSGGMPSDEGGRAGREEQVAADAGGPKRAGRSSVLRSWLRDLILSVTVSAFIIIFLYQPVRVEGTSMNPGLEDQDRLFINKLAIRVGEIHRGDVVVFLYPHDHSKSYIKRVIGLPGDQVRIDHGRVFVNGGYLREPYVPLRFADDRSQPTMELPANEFFVLGDHRCVASDSRDFGPVPRELIYGKAAFVYWPVDQAGVVR